MSLSRIRTRSEFASIDIQIQDSSAVMTKRMTELAKFKADAVARIISAQVRRNLQGVRGGKRRRVPGTQTFYNVSLPGEFPAFRTGALFRSIKESVQAIPGGYLAQIGATAPYAKYLDGNESSPGIRPFLEKGWLMARNQCLSILQGNWKI